MQSNSKNTVTTPSIVAHPSVDEHALRSALSRFPTGVVVVTARTAAGIPVGLTVSSFSPVSLRPPLVLWSLGMSSSLLETFQNTAYYAINILRAEQLALCLQFAQRSADRFNGVAIRQGLHDLPLLQDALAWFECRNRSRYVEGDHMILVGEVERCDYAEGLPLIHHSRAYHLSQVHPDSPTQSALAIPSAKK